MSSALDRQVRPIYDALDTGSNKSALVACNKVLKKQPNNQLVKALKALALVRSQKVEESLVLCDEVLASKPSDDGVLSAMMHVLRGLGRHKDTVQMFEEAFKKEPTNEDLGVQTFLANVRAGHWKTAQQIATKIWKQFKKEAYLYWSVMATVLQANDSMTPAAMRPLLYQIAHRLISSSPSPSFQSADRFYLHLTILRELEMYEDALKLLGSEIGEYLCATSLVCNEVRREIWRAKGLIKEEGKRAEILIIEQNDRNWLEFLSILDATFAPASSEETEEARQASISEEISRVQQLFIDVAVKDGKKDRSGPLALLELELRARQHGFSTDPHRLLSLLKEYFETIGDKACCYEDLLPYIGLDEEDLSKWTTYLKDLASSYSPTSDLQRLINCHKLLRYNIPSDELTVDAELFNANVYTTQYLEALVVGKDLAVTDLQPADDLAILAGHAFVNLWSITQDEKHLYNAVSLLEFAVSKSKPSFRIRLMLIRLYRLLGAPSLAVEHYRLMQVKQIQTDTLSHFLLSRSSPFSLAATGDLTFMTEHVEASQIYLTNTQDTPEYVVRAFTGEKYSQIPEFVEFENRVECSLQKNVAKVEHTRMRLGFDLVSPDIVDMELIDLKFIFDREHFDNRDFDVLPNYQPKSSPSLNEQTTLFGSSEGQGWLWSFMKVYIRAFQHASNLDDTVEDKLLVGDRPKPTEISSKPLKERLSNRDENELAELTEDELSFVRFADALANWLEPHHDHVRPPPAFVLAEAAKQTELKTGRPLKGLEIPPPTNGNPWKKDEEAPPVEEPPALLTSFFDDLMARFNMLKEGPSPVYALYVAALMQEAFVLLMLETIRFKHSSLIKIHKLGNLVAHLKPLKAKAVDTIKVAAAELVKMSESENTAARRKDIVDSCSALNLDHDFVFTVAKQLSDSRHSILEGYGKGMPRVTAMYPN